MECLYKLETNYSFKEYQKFNWAVSPKKRFAICILLVYLCFVFGYPTSDDYSRITFAILFPVIIFISVLLTNRKMKKIYESNILIPGVEMTFEFYDTYFIQRTTNGETKVEYCLLQKLIETKTNFYPMTSQMQGFILSKEQFPEGLEIFLRSKFPKSK